MKNYKTPLDKIFFRSSKISLLVSGLERHGLTENQREEMEKLELMKITPIGLTEKQASDLTAWDEKIKAGETLTPGQMEKRDEYRSRLTTPKGLTAIQETRLETLKEINSRPPELSDGAKTYVKEVWLENEKGFVEEITDKKLKKGKQGEEDAIRLISDVDRITYYKNSKRVYKDNITGECDVIDVFKDIEFGGKYFDRIKVIHDTKCSWNPRTFMSSSLTTSYEWQGRAYLYLYDADIFKLRFCLVDCPPDVFKDEYDRFRAIHKIRRKDLDDLVPVELLDQLDQCFVSEKYPEYQFVNQFYNNYFYEQTGFYTKEERVKTFEFERDYDKEETLKLAVKLAVEYYQTIKLNMIE